MGIDYTGEHGGQLAMAFAAGCVACSAFWGVVGKYMWSILGKAKDDRIAELEALIVADRAQCAAMETRLVQRIQQLEGFVLAMSTGDLRQQVQLAISEGRVIGEKPHE
ncbi:hypothetical protein [Sphingobium sp. YG1]|uniref:hypothetical protein n=1 Tax=Sphingobium sp. YG1 TaxID=2082188 RepID=UPI0011AE2D60|nr:hypothetical protein [Sphingobium sp. YG1]